MIIIRPSFWLQYSSSSSSLKALEETSIIKAQGDLSGNINQQQTINCYINLNGKNGCHISSDSIAGNKRHSMEVTHFSDHGNQGCQSDAPWRKIEKKSQGGVRLTRDGERSKSTFCGKMYDMKMKFTFHWLLCTFSRLYTIIIIMQDSMAMRCLNIFDVWLYYTFPGWWNAFESPMYQFFLKNRRNVVESSNVPFTVMVIQSGSFFREFRTGGICRGSTAWIISCGRRWWKHVTLALYLIYKKAEREKTMGWHSMAMKISSFFWCFYWGLVLGQPFQSILRSTETNGCSSCVSWPGAGNFKRKFFIKLRLHSGNSTWNLENDGFQ